MTIRRVTPEDLPAISAIQGPSSWEPFSYLSYDCHVAELENGIAGFLVSRQVASGEREILNLAVNPADRRQGIGRALLRHELASPDAFFLEVRESNTAALNLYQSSGFQEVGRRDAYYGDPAEAAIVMRFFS